MNLKSTILTFFTVFLAGFFPNGTLNSLKINKDGVLLEDGKSFKYWRKVARRLQFQMTFKDPPILGASWMLSKC